MTRTEKWRDRRETIAADRFDVNEAYETLIEEVEQLRDRVDALEEIVMYHDRKEDCAQVFDDMMGDPIRQLEEILHAFD